MLFSNILCVLLSLQLYGWIWVWGLHVTFHTTPLLPGFPHTLVPFPDKNLFTLSIQPLHCCFTYSLHSPSLTAYPFLRPFSVHLASSLIQLKYTCKTIRLKLRSSYEREHKTFVFQAPSYIIQQFFPNLCSWVLFSLQLSNLCAYKLLVSTLFLMIYCNISISP